MRLLVTLSTVAMLLAAPAFAQSGNPAFMAFGTGPEQPNNTDRVFVAAAVRGGMAEVELGRLAEENAHSDAVKDFARRMVEEHGEANDRLIALAKEDDVAVPEELDDEHKAMRDSLQAVSGEAFDLAYIQGRWRITKRRCSSWNTRSARARTSSSRASRPRSSRSCSTTSKPPRRLTQS